jgi:uncharacterized protein (TIGR00288 family)
MTVAPHVSAPIHAPNAALLIDFDNVTMGIRSDLGKELRSLLSSEIIKGKVAVQRAYADWRRYPQYIVPLSEASIDLIFAPAYGSSKKNATDIRLAIDALELVFTRPEIGTFILLSGDSDFSSLVIKLKEYGKYVIGVGIRESSSDLLVQNCDEYYSYNALAGLVKASEEEQTRKYDPWELVTEAVQRMKRNNDVMRSDRLKQVMQEIDSTFDEKNLGISKFSRFCQEAAQKGLLSITKLDNGQLEVDLPGVLPAPETRPSRPEPVTPSVETIEAAPLPSEERAGRRGRRGRGGRGRERDGGEQRESRPAPAIVEAEQARSESEATAPARPAEPPADLELAVETLLPPSLLPSRVGSASAIGAVGERLTRAEAFDLVKRAVDELAPGDESARASEVRRRARQLLGHDSESLNERMFVRILKDAHDAGIIDLRRRGDDFEVARAAEAAPVAEQLAQREQAAAASVAHAAPAASVPRFGMGPRGAGTRGRPGAPPPELLAVGVVEQPPVVTPGDAAAVSESKENGGPPVTRAKRGRGGRGRGGAKVAASTAPGPEESAPSESPASKPGAKSKRGRAGAKKKSSSNARARGKKTAIVSDE